MITSPGYWNFKAIEELTFDEFEEMEEDIAQRLYGMSLAELREKIDSTLSNIA